MEQSQKQSNEDEPKKDTLRFESRDDDQHESPDNDIEIFALDQTQTPPPGKIPSVTLESILAEAASPKAPPDTSPAASPDASQDAPQVNDPNLTPGEKGLPTVSIETPDDVKPLIRYGDVLLSDISRLSLSVGPGGELGTMDIGIQDELIVGRSVEGQPYAPSVDLTPYNAYQYGVSRYHLKIERRGDTLYVTDLGSQNGTYLNGVRMYANQARVLRDDDELLLGRLLLTVCFIGAESSEG